MDSSGSPIQHNGTLGTGVSEPSRVLSDNTHAGGGFGNFMRFDGNDAVTMNHNGNTELDLSGLTAFTMEFWFRQNAAQHAQNVEIMGFESNDPGGWVIVHRANSHMTFAQLGIKNYEFTSLIPVAGDWNHFALVR